MPTTITNIIAFSFTLYSFALLLLLGVALHCSPVPSNTNTKNVIDAPPPAAIIDAPIPDFTAIDSPSDRKQVFFEYFRPLIAAQNSKLKEARQNLLEIDRQLQQNEPFTRLQQRLLTQLAERFAVEADSPEALITELKVRVNVLPESMVLAQAAAESGWGTSRFAREAHNYFGQWCYTEGCGLVPSRRAAGARHEVRRFDSPYGSVRGYFHNINTHRAYQELRDVRQQQFEQEETVTGLTLIQQLTRYSERGQPYVDELRAIIVVNDLE